MSTEPKFRAGESVEIRNYETGEWTSAILIETAKFYSMGKCWRYEYLYSPIPQIDPKTRIRPSVGGSTSEYNIREAGKKSETA